MRQQSEGEYTDCCVGEHNKRKCHQSAMLAVVVPFFFHASAGYNVLNENV